MGDKGIRREDVAALAAAVLVLFGAAMARVVTHDGGTTVRTDVLGEGFTRPTTSRSLTPATTAPTQVAPGGPAAAAPAPPPTTAAPGSPPATAAPTTTTSAPAPPPPTTTTVPVDCGSGDTRASATVDVVDQPDPARYALAGKVEIVNNRTKAAHIDKLVVRLTFDDLSKELVEITAAAGQELQASETKTLDFQHTASRAPMSAGVETLEYHLVGAPGCLPQP